MLSSRSSAAKESQMNAPALNVAREPKAESKYQSRPLSKALGVEILGLDLAAGLDDRSVAALRTALAENCFLLFRDQKITPDEHIRFSRRFGELQLHVLKDYSMANHPELFVVSNIKQNQKPIGRAGAGQYWHSDFSYVEEPSLGSIMYAIEVPTVGGDTLFANMYKSYAALSEPMKRFLKGLKAEHDFAYQQATFISGRRDTRTATAEELALRPPVHHPVIRIHPESKREALYVSPGMTSRIIDIASGESRAVLDFLFAHTTKPEFVYRHQWQVGDVVFWDNRSSMHCAIDDYDESDRRHMVRTTIKDAHPF
jgi:taurine dioxygenase